MGSLIRFLSGFVMSPMWLSSLKTARIKNQLRIIGIQSKTVFVSWIVVVFFASIDSHTYLHIFIEATVYNQDMSSRYLIKIRCHAPNIAIKDNIVFVRWVEGKFFRVLKDVKFPNVLQFVDIYMLFWYIHVHVTLSSTIRQSNMKQLIRGLSNISSIICKQ